MCYSLYTGALLERYFVSKRRVSGGLFVYAGFHVVRYTQSGECFNAPYLNAKIHSEGSFLLIHSSALVRYIFEKIIRRQV